MRRKSNEQRAEQGSENGNRVAAAAAEDEEKLQHQLQQTGHNKKK